MLSRRVLPTSALALLTTAVVMSRQGAFSLSYNDTSVPTDVVMKGGHAYVSVASVAKLLNASVSQSGSTFSFKALDNSRQVNGNTGKVGQMVRLGIGNVTVTDVKVGTTYTATHGGNDATADAGQEIVAVSLHVQNSTLKSQILCVLGGDHTGLADKNGTSYPASSFSDFASRGPEMLPGSAVDFTLLFRVKAGTPIKDLVYELAYAGLNKTAQARISLETPTQ